MNKELTKMTNEAKAKIEAIRIISEAVYGASEVLKASGMSLSDAADVLSEILEAANE